jgi:hypothetical protein
MRGERIFAVAFIAVSLSGCTDFDVAHSSYQSFEEAVSAGAVNEHSWLPSTMPETAYDIAISLNVDTNAVMFRYRSPRDGVVPHHCEEANAWPRGVPIRNRYPFVESAWIDEIEQGKGRWFTCKAEQYSFDLFVMSDGDGAIGWTPGDARDEFNRDSQQPEGKANDQRGD